VVHDWGQARLRTIQRRCSESLVPQLATNVLPSGAMAVPMATACHLVK